MPASNAEFSTDPAWSTSDMLSSEPISAKPTPKRVTSNPVFPNFTLSICQSSLAESDEIAAHLCTADASPTHQPAMRP